ncbi:MAG: hydroxylamine reductase [Deltaproteobacteria bacterium]|nr:hydroxylamine reductase [Deltaproteobacteria bacterium]
MFCYQCQETSKNQGCTVKGVCGKSAETANLQDLLIYALRGIGLWHQKAKELGLAETNKTGRLVIDALFSTITNANFDERTILDKVVSALALRDQIRARVVDKSGSEVVAGMHDAATWAKDRVSLEEKAAAIGVLSTEDEDVRSLRELLIYGLKGIAAYTHHAMVLGKEKAEIYDFLLEALASTTKTLGQSEMVGMVLKAGEIAVTTMALLDAANTEAYGNPEITEVKTGAGTNPAILVSGHDLKDLQELLEQTQGTGVDVYTHSEMLPAHYYPVLKRYPNLVGNYGDAWHAQKTQFKAFNGPIIMTTNCIIPIDESYRDRIFTTGVTGYPGVAHIPDRSDGKPKDFSAVIAKAKTCAPPTELEKGTITGGFAHNQVLALADKIVEAVKSGAIKRFVVMAGCDGRQKGRSYYTEVARALPDNSVILTAGCAKYRYNKLALGTIGGIPRVLDAGQCNDCYSLAVIALKLKEVFGLDDINQLPISFDVAWYEQKAVAVLLALLHLGVKGIRLGPTLPAFLSPNVAKVLVENFNIKPIGDVASDIDAMMSGR